MSYSRLAEDLSRIASRLREREADLEGLALAKSAEKLRDALQRFEKVLESALKGTDPDTVALKRLLDSPDAQKALDPKTLRLLAKKAFGKALTLKVGEAPRQHRQRFLDAAVKHEKTGEASQALRDLLLEARRPPPDLENRDAVLAEVWRLASLSPADLEIEKLRLLGNEPLVRAMAAAAYIPATPRSTARSILTRVVKFSKRVKENVS